MLITVMFYAYAMDRTYGRGYIILFGIATAIVLSIWLSYRISAPLRNLAIAARAGTGTYRCKTSDQFISTEYVALCDAFADAARRQRKYQQQVTYLAHEAPLLLFIVDLTGTTAYATGRLLHLFGWDHRTVVGANIARILPPGVDIAEHLAAVRNRPMSWVLEVAGLVVELRATITHSGEPDKEHFLIVGFDASDARLAKRNGAILQQLRSLNGSARSAAETERRRLASELHDRLGQDLTAIRSYATLIRSTSAAHIDVGAVYTRIPEFAEQIDNTANHLQTVISSMLIRLWPESIDTHGLTGALQELAGAWKKQNPDIRLSVKLSGGSLPFTQAEAIALYRIAVEGLTNIARHAHAKSVHLATDVDNGEFIIILSDDGIGFTAHLDFPGHHGIPGIQERVTDLGGTLDIDSAVGHGTTLTVRVPLPQA